MNGKYLSQAVKILVLVSLAGVSVTAEANPPSRPPSGYNDAGVQLNRTREYIEREQIARRIQEERNKQQSEVEAEKGSEQGEASGSVLFLLQKVVIDDSQVLSQAEIASVTDKYVGHEVSLQKLNTLVSELNKLYEDKGYLTCRAVFPPQTIKEGIVHINLVGAEIEMLNLKNREKILKEVLAPLREEFDYILIDCSPSLGLITINALTAADSVIIPVQAEYFALEGISKLLNTIKIIKSKLNPALEIEGFLLTMYDSRLRQANQIYDEVKRHFQELVFNTVIQRNVKLSEAPSYGLPTILYDADSTGAKNHIALAKELISHNED